MRRTMRIWVAIFIGLIGVISIPSSRTSADCGVVGKWVVTLSGGINPPPSFSIFGTGVFINNGNPIPTGEISYTIEGYSDAFLPVAAIPGVDFTPTSGSMTFDIHDPATQQVRYIFVPALPNPQRITDRGVRILLTSYSDSVTLCQPPGEVTSYVPKNTLIPTPTPEPPRRVPVILVHGYNDEASDDNPNSWADYKALITALGRKVFIADLNTGYAKEHRFASRTSATVEENAKALQVEIDKAKQTYKAKQVDLVVHSMGGIFARYYIAHLMDPSHPDVRRLIMLGTPNSGAASATVLEFAHRFGIPCVLGQCYIYPATTELTPHYMRSFNQQTQARYGAAFYGLAGHYGNCVFKLPPFPNPLDRLPNDVAVWEGSVSAIPLDQFMVYPASGYSCEGDHRGMRSTAAHDGGQGIFDTFVEPLLPPDPPDAEPRRIAPTAAGDPEAAYAAITQIQFTDVETGTVRPNAPITFTRRPEASDAYSFVVFGNADLFSLSLRSPGGTESTPANPGTGVQYTRLDDPIGPLSIFTVNTSVPGDWMLTVAPNSSTPAAGVPLLIVGSLQTDLRLTFPAVPAVSVNHTLTVIAQLMQGTTPVTGATITTHLGGPDGRLLTLNLHDDGQAGDQAAGDGTYSATFTPSSAGVYSAAVEATTLDGARRSSIWAAQVDGKRVLLPLTNR